MKNIILFIAAAISTGCNKINQFKTTKPSEQKLLDVLKEGSSSFDAGHIEISKITLKKEKTEFIKASQIGTEKDAIGYGVYVDIEIKALKDCYLRIKSINDSWGLAKHTKSKIPLCVNLEELNTKDKEKIITDTDFSLRKSGEVLTTLSIESMRLLCFEKCSDDNNWRSIVKPRDYFKK